MTIATAMLYSPHSFKTTKISFGTPFSWADDDVCCRFFCEIYGEATTDGVRISLQTGRTCLSQTVVTGRNNTLIGGKRSRSSLANAQTKALTDGIIKMSY